MDGRRSIGADSECRAQVKAPKLPRSLVIKLAMKMNKLIPILVWALLPVISAWAKNPSLLPTTFNGWQLSQPSLRTGSDPAAVDPADFAVLKEYGFSDFENATYVRDGRSMQVKAARFSDASGAFGAFTFYVQPQMRVEQIGDAGASNNSRVLFYRGNILVDAKLERVTAMSAADLRALADSLPRARGNVSALPALPKYLPKQSLLPNTERYIMGPVALERLAAPIPANLVDFSTAPDVELAKYRSSTGDADLTLIEYPTPQIAAQRLRAWQAALSGPAFHVRRSGPILIAVSGDVAESEAQSLLASVNYDADVTWNQSSKPNRLEDRGAFIIAEVLLVLIVLGMGLFLGLAFGGFRILAKKLFPNRGFDRREEAEIISLNLKGPR